MGSVIVGLVLVAIVAACVFSLVRTKRRTGHIASCGGNCASCGGACGCAKNGSVRSAETPFQSEEKPIKI